MHVRVTGMEQTAEILYLDATEASLRAATPQKLDLTVNQTPPGVAIIQC